VPDAESAEGESFGMQRLIDVLNSCKEKTVPDTLNSVLDAVRGYSDIDSQFDDITMLCVCYMGDEVGKYKEITLQAVIENAPVAMEFLENELRRVRCGDKLNRRIVLAMEEIFVNVVSYAYGEGTGDVNLKVSYPVHNTVQIEVTDSGVKYNPLTKPDPDTKSPLRKRGKGGMGIFLAKKIMDEMDYEYKDGCNHLTMRKKYVV
jgi:sigma-B regulation protein RsbU (phosphoserine phosphatase)